MRGITTFIMVLLCIIGISSYPSANLNAQDNEPKWGIDITGGFPYGYFNEGSRLTPLYGLALHYAVSPAYMIQLNAHKGNFKVAERSNYYGRWFDNNFFQLTARQQINLFELVNLHSVAKYADINGFAGIGFINSNVKTHINTSIPGYEQWKGINYKGNSIAYSFGGGVTFKITRNISFIMQYEYNLTNSDYIDGYKTVEGNSINAPPARVGNDAFSFTTAGFSINFGGRKSRSARINHMTENNPPDLQQQSLQQMEKLGSLIKNNAENLEETNNQIKQTLQLLTEYVKTSSANQNETQRAYSQKLQQQIDSLRSQQLRADSLISLKQKVDSLIQQRKREAIKAAAKKHSSRTTNSKYYIVADSYLDYDKASTFLTKLKSEGYDNATIVNDQTKTYYLVAYTVMHDEKAANLMLKKIKSYQNPMAWLYKTR